MYLKWLYLFYLLSFIGCINTGESEFIHPSEDLIESFDLSISLTQDLKFEAQETEEKGDLITSIGNDNIEENDFLHFTNNAVLDHNQNIFVPFPVLNQIKVFGPNGKFLFSFGKDGRGPGEFLELGKLTFNREKNLLIVVDRREFEIFTVLPDTVKYLKTILTNVENVSDICSFGDYFYSNGFSIAGPETELLSNNNSEESFTSIRASKPIHKFNLNEGEKILDFGDPVIESESSYGIFDGIMSEVFLSCDPKNEIIVSINRYYPFFFAYSTSNGERIWKMVIKDFNGIRFEEKASALPTLNKIYPKDFYNYYDDIINTSTGVTLLQLGSGVPRGLSLQKSYDFLKKGFAWNNIYIDNLTGKVLNAKKYKNQVLFRNETKEISISPIKDLSSSLILELRELD